MTHYAVLSNRLAVKLDEPWEDERQYRGLYLPAGVKLGKDEPVWGTVIAVGTEVHEEVGCGDRVLVGRFAGMPIPSEDDGKTIFIVKQFELMAKEEEDG